jgi:hypothetical protein
MNRSNKTLKFYAQYRCLRNKLMYHGRPRLRDIQIIADLVQLDNVYISAVLFVNLRSRVLFGSPWQERAPGGLAKFSNDCPLPALLVEQLGEKAVDMVVQAFLRANKRLIYWQFYKDLGIYARLANQVRPIMKLFSAGPLAKYYFDLISRLKAGNRKFLNLRWSQYVAAQSVFQTIVSLIPEIEKINRSRRPSPGFTGNCRRYVGGYFHERPVLAGL